MSTAKAEVEGLLRTLPDDATLEDIQYHLYVLEKVKKGEERAAKEGILDQDDVTERMRKWLAILHGKRLLGGAEDRLWMGDGAGRP